LAVAVAERAKPLVLVMTAFWVWATPVARHQVPVVVLAVALVVSGATVRVVLVVLVVLA
jgi:hypothetical protein